LVSEGVINKLFERFEKALSHLESLKDITLQKLHEDWMIQGALLHEFQVAIQCMIDIGSHLIAEFGWESPKGYTSLPEILVKHGVIPEDYGKTLQKIFAFRNILVHEYMELSLEKVYENLQSLEDLRRFANFVKEFLESKS